MRLGQLSRQLEISSDKIVKVLADNFREVNNHPNIKITEEEGERKEEGGAELVGV